MAIRDLSSLFLFQKIHRGYKGSVLFVSLPKDSPWLLGICPLSWLLGICPLCFSSKRFTVAIRDLSSLFLFREIQRGY